MVSLPRASPLYVCTYTFQLNRDSVSYEPLSGPEVEEIRQQVDCFLHGTLSDIEVRMKPSCVHTTGSMYMLCLEYRVSWV